MTTPAGNDSDNRLRARLALTDEADIVGWQEKEAYLEKRKSEAAKAMASDNQKRIQTEKEQAIINKTEAQKKLAELEVARKAEEELKKESLATKQREQDSAQEKLRQAKIKQILESQKTIESIKRTPHSQLPSVRTLTDDLSEAIRVKGLTAAKLAQTNRQVQSEADKTVSWRKTLILTLSLILLVGGLTAISWSAWQKVDKSRAPAKLNHNSIIFADEQSVIDLKNKTPEQIKQELKTSSLADNTTSQTRGKIKDIYFTYEVSQNTDQGLLIERKIADPTLFTAKAGLIITDDLLRFLTPDFMLGIYAGPSPEPFYIFQTGTYQNVADALRHNENGIVSQLLSPFIEAETELKIRLTPFQDKLINNRDVRLVIDQDNRILALYTWLDKNTLAVTISETTLEKILNSFLTPKPLVQ